MKKKFLLIIPICLLSILILIGIYTLVSKKSNTYKNTQQTIAKCENKTDNIQSISKEPNNDANIIEISSALDRFTIPTTEELFNDNTKIIVLGKIKSIDDGINYNPTQKVYTTICSIGTMEITEVVKGNLEQSVIPIIKMGGEVTLKEYEAGLSEPQKVKMEEMLNVSDEEKENTIIKSYYDEMVEPEIGKEYLFTLEYNSDYNRYLIYAFPEETREIQRIDKSENMNKATSSSTSSNKNSNNTSNGTILVKDVTTGKWDNLEDLKSLIK